MGPCMCGGTDCPSCGPAQGYTVVRVWDHKVSRYVYRNPDECDADPEYGDDRDEDAEDAAREVSE